MRGYGLLAILLVISLACMTIYAREGDNGFMHSLQKGTSALFSPLKLASGTISSMEYSAFTSFEDATADKETLSALKEQNEQLRQTVSELEEYRQEARRLNGLLNYQDMYDLEGITASVISRSTDSWNRVITIDKGSNDGVVAGLPVIGPTGLVGQVISTSSKSAEVRLLQDAKSGVAVMIQSNREEGILKGSYDGLLYLENVGDDVEVKEGDVIITSGSGGSYFRGITVGTVVKVEGETGSSSRKIIVEPNESTGPLQEVMVIYAMNSEGDAAEEDEESSSDDSSSSSGESSDGYTDSTVSNDTTSNG